MANYADFPLRRNESHRLSYRIMSKSSFRRLDITICSLGGRLVTTGFYTNCCYKTFTKKIKVPTVDECKNNQPSFNFKITEKACSGFTGTGKYINLGNNFNVKISPNNSSKPNVWHWWDKDLFNNDDLFIAGTKGNYTLILEDKNSGCIYQASFTISEEAPEIIRIANSCNYKVKCSGKEVKEIDNGPGYLLEKLDCIDRVVCKDGTERLIEKSGEWIVKDKCNCYAEKVCETGILYDSENGIRKIIKQGGCYEVVECSFNKGGLGKKEYDCAQNTTLCSIKSSIYAEPGQPELWQCADFVFDCNLQQKIQIREYPNFGVIYSHLICSYPKCPGLIAQGKNIASFLPSIKENERYSISNISIFPNPFTNFINIGLDMKQSDNLTVKMYDMLHRQIHSQQFNTIAGENLISFEIGETLVNGIYTIEIETSNGSKAFAKVIKGN